MGAALKKMEIYHQIHRGLIVDLRLQDISKDYENNLRNPQDMFVATCLISVEGDRQKRPPQTIAYVLLLVSTVPRNNRFPKTV